MKKYYITIECVYTYSTTIECDNEEQAKDLALNELDLSTIDGNDLEVSLTSIEELEL